MPQNNTLLATAIAHGLLSLGHTTKGLEMFKNPSFKNLPALLHATVKAGWFEGSVFFAIMGLLNYRWATSPESLKHPLDLTIASLISALCFGAGGYYGKSGDKGTMAVLSVAGILQAVGIKSGSGL